MKKALKSSVIFSVGALGYGFMEILWRGRTHPSMLMAGGIVFSISCRINSKYREAPLWLRSCTLSAIITGIELLFGSIFNIILKMNVWDYSSKPFNFKGQICLTYSALWTLLSFVICALSGMYVTRRKRTM